MKHYHDAGITVHVYYFINRDAVDSNPDSDSGWFDLDSDSRKKGWIRIRIHEKRGGFGFRFEMPGFAHHWSVCLSVTIPKVTRY